MKSNYDRAALPQMKKMVGMAFLTAIVIVLQLIGSVIKIGPCAISLVLVPIVVGASLYGAWSGAFLGMAFGVVVLIACINGTDMGGFLMWSSNWYMTVVVCLLKGSAAGLAAGAVYKAISRRNDFWATVLAALVCPIVNTGIFCISLPLFYKDLLTEWAGGTSVIYYILFTLVGLNFLVETAVNLILSPAIVRITRIRRKQTGES